MTSPWTHYDSYFRCCQLQKWIVNGRGTWLSERLTVELAGLRVARVSGAPALELSRALWRSFLLIVTLTMWMWAVSSARAQDSPVPHIDLPLVPTTVRPGSSGFTLTVNGTGFTSGSKIVWNGSQRTTTFLSETQLTAAVTASDVRSAGTASVSVTNPAPGGGGSNNVIFEISDPLSAASFSGTSFATGSTPASIVVADFNGDGIQDFAVANEGGDTISIVRGVGNGSFEPQVTYATGDGPAEIALGDFNHDGYLDVAVVNSGENASGQLANSVSILLGNGDGTFQTHLDYPTGQMPVSVAVGDFNGDGNLDLAVVDQYDDAVSILLGKGDGTFQSQIEYGVSSQPMQVVVSDLNRDGILDLVTANFAAHTVSVLLGNGDGTFQAASDYTASQEPSSLVAADFNGDGIPDVAVAEFGSTAVALLLGNGDGTLQNQVRYTTGTYPEAVITGDFNGDGILDLALATDDRMGSVSVLLGDGNGTFQPALDFPAGLLPVSLAAADFNLDGLLDLATADVNSNSLLVLLGSTLVFTPTSVNFGTVNLGVSSTPQGVTLTNVGASAVSISNIATSASFSETNSCGSSLSAGGNCSVSLTFTPTGVGSVSGVLTITDSAAGSPQIVALSGNGNGATVSFSPPSLDFGSQIVNTTSAGQTVTMTNTGNTTLNITSISASAQYAIAGSTCGSTLAAAANCSFNVKFTPTQTGTVSGSVIVADNGYPNPQTVSLTGVGSQGVAALNPTSLNFGVQLLNTPSAPQNVTLTNTGTAPITINSITNLTSFTQTNTCGSSVAVGASCTITVIFKPVNINTLSGTINIFDNAASSPQKVSVSGVGTQINVNPSTLNFGPVALGTTSSATAVTLTNVGSNSVSINSVGFTGTNSAEFAQTNTCGTSVGADASCTFSVTFTPAGTGTRTATLSVYDSGGASPQTVNLSGTGSPAGSGPIALFNPASLSFGSQNYKTRSRVMTTTLTNTGSAALTIASIMAGGDYTDTTTCTSSLSPGASCSISVTFTPTVVGTDNGTLTVTDNAPGSPQGVSLTGTGVGAVASVTPTSMAFAVQIIGSTSPAQAGIMTNTGNASLSITSITAPTNFGQTNNCGSSLAAGSSCTINVTFVPTKTGTLSGNININDNSAGSTTQRIAVSGTGTAMYVNPTNINFGSVNLGTTSSAQVVSVTNESSNSVSITSVTLTGNNSSDFAKTNNCGSTLGAGATCTISLSFTPGGSGSRTATLNINDNGGASPQTVALSGTGNASGSGPQITLSPTSLNLGDQNYKTASRSQTVTIYSTGTTALSIASVTTSSTSFGVTSNNCPASLNPGSSCSVTADFDPQSVGTITGTLNFNDNAPASPQTVTLSGTGLGPIPAVSPTTLTFALQVVGTSSPSQPVTLGNTGNASLTINGITTPSGYTQTNTCGSSLAAGASCTINVIFAPTKSGTVSGSLTVSDNGAGNTSQKVTLTGTGTYASFSPTTLNFATVEVGHSSSAETVTMTNVNTINSFSITSMSFTGNNPGDFSQTNNCGKSLGAGASCSIAVTFTPQATGSRSASLSVADGAGGSPQTVSVTGNGD